MAMADYVNLTSSHHVSNYFVTWVATVPMVTVSLVTLTANGTVLVMFAIRPSLRRAKNAYLASLALADFLIGCYMPLLVLEEVGLIRVEGRGACHTYLTVRYSLLYVSLLSVLLITLDRWWSVRWPFSYRTRHTRRLAAYLIGALWTLSTTLYALPIFLWDSSSSSSSSSTTYDAFPVPVPRHLQSPSPHHPAAASTTKDGGDSDSSSSAALHLPLPSSTADHHRNYHYHNTHNNLGRSLLHPAECEVPYVLSFAWSALTCFVMYLLPLGAMWILNCSLYQKIRLRRSVEIRRSTSVTDMFFVTMKNSKPTIHITEAPSIVGPSSCNELPTPSSPLLPFKSSSSFCTGGGGGGGGCGGGGGGSGGGGACGGGGGGGVGSPTCHRSTPQLNSLHPDHWATPSMGRRHSSALVSLSPPSLTLTLTPTQTQQQQQQQQTSSPSTQSSTPEEEAVRRQLSQRRISLPDWALRGDWSPSSASNTSSRCRYVGRKWSGCGGGSTSHLGPGGGLTGLGVGVGVNGGSTTTGLFCSQDPLYNSGGGGGGGGGGGAQEGVEGDIRSQGNGASGGVDTVHELLVKQDQKVACCLALLLAACTVCWLPFACLTLLRAHCPPCVGHSAIVLCRWLLLANSAINPFLYGLLNAQFRNILRQWFYLDTSQRYRPARGDTYVYMGVSRQDGARGGGDLLDSAARDTSHVALSVMAPSSGR